MTDMTEAWIEFLDTTEMFSMSFEAVDAKDIETCLGEKGVSKSKIAENLASILHITKKNKAEYELAGLLAGKTAKLINIYGSEIIDEEHKALSICFRASNYDEKEQEIVEYLGDEYYTLIAAAKVIHDLGLLANIMKGKKFLTFARVEAYENHKKDLAQLKDLLRRYSGEGPDDFYNHFLRKMEDGNYSAYVGSVYAHGKRIRRNGGNGRTQEDLYKKLKGILSKLPQDEPDVVEILKKMEAEEFLPKQLTSSNGVIPNQVYVKEMKAILKNAEEHLPFLKEVDDSELSVSERILALFSFRIPYYVGPLGQEYAGKDGYNVWSVRKEQGRVFPWNFEQKIDTKQTAENFIMRMVRKCTYLSEERTLPKASLLYEKFMVLNELNNLKVYGEKISVEEKQHIFNTLFLTGKKVTVKQLEKYFISHGKVPSDAKDFLSGIDMEGGFKSSLSSYGKFKGVFGEELKKDECQKMVEDIIFWMTVYGDDKNYVKEKVEEVYPHRVSEAQMKRILGLKFADWGKLSKEFLQLTEKDVVDGFSLIQALWETNENLMELLSENHEYKTALIEKQNQAEKPLSEWCIEDLDEMYVSAPVKRMVWQTIKIMKELSEVTGHEADRIFVEMPRKEGEKDKRTISRKKKLSDLYHKVKEDERNWRDEIEGKEEADFRSKKLYLYYLQKGRCMYTGEVIDLHTLLTDNTSYDIDHIYPRHFIKDDSIENNLVLVKKQVNAAKTDSYPLSEAIRNNLGAFWKSLRDGGFITSEKYARLTRTTPFTSEEKASFINRQLVETGQGTKVITQVLQSAFPDAKVVFSKAGEVSDFRKKYDLVKVRCVNDLHHAKDAYLNIVVGNTYYVKFTANPLKYIIEAQKHTEDSIYKYNMDRIFEYDVIRNGEIAWIGTTNKQSSTLSTVRKVLGRNTVLITKRTYVAHGGITAKDTVYSAKTAKSNSGAYLAMSSDERVADVSKYGGRTAISTQCYCLVSYQIGKKQVLSLEAVPVYLGDINQISDDCLLNYLQKSLREENGNKEISNVIVKYKCIRFNSLVKIDGHLYNLGGKTGSAIYLKNAQPLYLEERDCQYIKKIEKALSTDYYGEKDANHNVIITAENNIKLYSILVEKISTVYRNKKSSIIDTLICGKESFSKTNLQDQVFTILQIVAWLGLTSLTVDMTKIKGASKAGRCKVNKKISGCSEALLINQSITGLFINTIDLLKL